MEELHLILIVSSMFKALLNEPLVCAVIGLLLGFALGLCYANCFAQPRGEQRPRQRAARGELKMVFLVRTDLGMQKGTFCSKYSVKMCKVQYRKTQVSDLFTVLFYD